jgi:thiamine biosynthesis protein ThiI
MRKGLTVEFVHFATPPHTTEESLYKVFDLVKELTKFAGKLKVHVVDFTPIQNEIFCSSKESYRITLMRRFFYRIAAEIANQTNCLAIANGESIGQVASQTLESMNAINSVTNIPVLRPLSVMDKVDIIEIAKRIGTYETSIIPHEDCCSLFVPKNPVTKPTAHESEKQEAHMFADGLIKDAIEKMKTHTF